MNCPTVNRLGALLYNNQLDLLLSTNPSGYSDPDDLFLLRYYQGKAYWERKEFDKAHKLFNELRGEPGHHGTVANVWATYLQLFVKDGARLDSVLLEINSLNKKVGKNYFAKSICVEVHALTCQFGVASFLLGKDEAKDFLAGFRKAAKLYRKAGCIYDAINAEYNFVSYSRFHDDNFDEQLEYAKRLLASQPVELPYQRLRLEVNKVRLELVREFRDGKTKISEVHTEEINRIKVSMNELSPSDATAVDEMLGSTMLNFGNLEGTRLLENVKREYFRLNDRLRASSVAYQLSSWYGLFGNYLQADKTSAEGQALQPPVLTRTFGDRSILDRVYANFVSGNHGDAIREGEQFLRTNPTAILATPLRTLLANAFLSSHQYEKAKNILVVILNQYEKAKVVNDSYMNNLLVYTILNNVDLTDKIVRLVAVSKAASLDQHRAFKIMALTQLGNAVAKMPGRFFEFRGEKFTPTSCFSAAISVAKDSVEIKVVSELVRAMHGYASDQLRLKLFDEAIATLEDARSICLKRHLHRDLTFAHFYCATACYQKYRHTKDATWLDHAIEEYRAMERHIYRTREFQQRLSLYGLLGRALFEQAKCSDDSARRIDNFNEAKHYFIKYAFLRKRLRKEVGSGSLDESALTTIRFNEENQLALRDAFNLETEFFSDYTASLAWLDQLKSQTLLDMISLSATQATGENYMHELVSCCKQFLKAELFSPAYDRAIDLILERAYSPDLVFQAQHEADQILLSIDKVQNLVNDQSVPMIVCQYYYTESDLYIFLLRQGQTKPKMIKRRIDVSALNEVTKLLADAPTMNGGDLYPSIMLKWQSHAYLVEDLAANSKANDLVYLIPHGVLHDLPLHSLVLNNHKPLIERNPVAYVPSLGILQIILEREEMTVRQFDNGFIFGNPTADLRYAEKEALSAATLTNSRLFLRDACSREDFLAAYENGTFLHFAGHGHADLNDGLSQFLLLAGGSRISAQELIRVKSKLNLMVLSGCRTGVTQRVYEGDECLGLTYAALSSGVQSAIVSRWLVHDASGAQFFDAFYDILIRREKKVVALQQAIKQLISMGMPLHTWANFSLIGDWR